MKLKKLLSLGMATTILAAMMAGCGGSTATKETPPAEGEKTESEADKEEGQTASADAKSVKLSVGTNRASKAFAKDFSAKLEEVSGGKMTTQVYADNQLGGDREVAEATIMGDVDISLVATTPVANFDPNLYIFDTPFLFKNGEQAYPIIDNEMAPILEKSLEKVGLKLLGLPENGFRCLTTKDTPVHSPADLKGLKVRVMENDIHLATWKALGASPTPMAFTELFTALQQKTIDAQENPMQTNYDNKFHEVQNYAITTNHVYIPFLLSMNLDTFNGLNAEEQGWIMEASKYATDLERQNSTTFDQDAMNEMTKYGTNVIVLNDEEVKAFREATKDIFNMVEEKVADKELIEIAKKALNS